MCIALSFKTDLVAVAVIAGIGWSAGLRVARINLEEIIAVAFVASFRVVALVHAITGGFTFVDVITGESVAVQLEARVAFTTV